MLFFVFTVKIIYFFFDSFNLEFYRIMLTKETVAEIQKTVVKGQ